VIGLIRGTRVTKLFALRYDRRRAAIDLPLIAIYLSLLADVVLFFAKPLFSSHYILPWDFRGIQLPLLTFLRDRLQEGHFALWNPLSYCGYPVFANIEACYFQPLVLLATIVSAILSPESLPKLIEWVVVLQIWGAGIASYHLLLELGINRPAAWMGAIIFQTGGYFASQAEHIGAVMAVTWMPLIWLAVLKLSRQWNRRWFAVLCLALGLSVVGGFPAATLSVYISALVWAAALAVFRFSRIRLVAISIAGCAAGIALAAVQFAPTAQLTENSVAKYRAGWLGAGGGMFPQSLVSLLLPNHYHIFDMSAFNGPGDPTFLYLYSSIIGLVLAIFAVATRRHRYCLPVLSLCLFGAWLMLGEHTPLWGFLYPLLPEKIRIGIHPEYTYGIFTLSLAVLAAMGLATLRVSNKLQYALGLLVAIDLWVVGSGRPMNCASLKLEPGVTRTAFGGNRELLEAVRRLTLAESPPARIDTTDASIEWSANGPITEIPTANGLSPLALENVIQLRLFFHAGEPWGCYYPIEKLDSPVIDLMGIKYILTSAKGRALFERYPQYRHVKSLPLDHEVFENLSVLPRFFLVHDFIAAQTPAEARRIIGRKDFDFRKTAVVDTPLSPLLGISPARTEAVNLVSYQPDELSVKVRSAGTSLLVLSESYYPGWKAWVDSTPADVHRADIAFRGILVPDGDHLVRMQFSPAILPLSLAVTILTGIGLLTMLLRSPGHRRTLANAVPAPDPQAARSGA
jgi:hypothetical protein